MQIILTRNVKELGKIGDVKDVKPGYYRNLLHPKGLAFVATPNRLKWAEGISSKALKAKAEIAKEAGKYKEQIEGMTITIETKTTDKDTLYGSIGEKELVKEIEKAAKLTLDKKQIKLKEPIKTVGIHDVTLELAEGVEVVIKVEVKAKE